MSLAVAKADDSYVDIQAEAEDVDQEIADSLYQLTPKAQQVFWHYIDNILSGCKLNDGDFARKFGYSYQHFSVLKTRPCWIRAYQLIITNHAIARTLAKTDEYIDNLENLAKEDTNANKALLNISNVLKRSPGVVINNNPNQVNVNIPNMNPLEMLDYLLISIGKAGVTLDTIADRYIELKNQNAF